MIAVRFDIGYMRRQILRTEAFWKKAGLALLLDASTKIAEVMKKEAPRAKKHKEPGPTLRESIKVEIDPTKRSAWIGPTVPYAIYVEFETKPSPGRYVPVLEKRLVKPSVRNQ